MKNTSKHAKIVAEFARLRKIADAQTKVHGAPLPDTQIDLAAAAFAVVKSSKLGGDEGQLDARMLLAQAGVVDSRPITVDIAPKIADPEAFLAANSAALSEAAEEEMAAFDTVLAFAVSAAKIAIAGAV